VLLIQVADVSFWFLFSTLATNQTVRKTKPCMSQLQQLQQQHINLSQY